MKSKFRKVKIIAVAFICILTLNIVSMPIRASAYDINEIERSLSTIEPRAQKYDVIDDISSFISQIASFFSELTESNSLIKDAIDAINDLLNPTTSTTWIDQYLRDWATEMTTSVGGMFDLVETQLENGVDANILSNSNYSGDINIILGYISVMAATFASIFWGIGQVRNAIHYEEWTEKKFALAIGAVFISASLIRNSARICLWIYSQEAVLVSRVVSSGGTITDTISEAIDNANYNMGQASGVPIIGVALDFIASFFMFIPLGLCIVFLLIMAGLVYIKLVLRELEIATMACVSPIFFGCWVSETTRPYLKNFIATFLSVVFETLFMAITLRLGALLLANKVTITGQLEMIKVMEVFILSGAIMVMCFKPPQILSNLVRA